MQDEGGGVHMGKEKGAQWTKLVWTQVIRTRTGPLELEREKEAQLSQRGRCDCVRRWNLEMKIFIHHIIVIAVVIK